MIVKPGLNTQGIDCTINFKCQYCGCEFTTKESECIAARFSYFNAIGSNYFNAVATCPEAFCKQKVCSGYRVDLQKQKQTAEQTKQE